MFYDLGAFNKFNEPIMFRNEFRTEADFTYHFIPIFVFVPRFHVHTSYESQKGH